MCTTLTHCRAQRIRASKTHGPAPPRRERRAELRRAQRARFTTSASPHRLATPIFRTQVSKQPLVRDLRAAPWRESHPDIRLLGAQVLAPAAAVRASQGRNGRQAASALVDVALHTIVIEPHRLRGSTKVCVPHAPQPAGAASGKPYVRARIWCACSRPAQLNEPRSPTLFIPSSQQPGWRCASDAPTAALAFVAQHCSRPTPGISASCGGPTLAPSLAAARVRLAALPWRRTQTRHNIK